MRRPTLYATGRRSMDVRMTPMIDVVFQLLIFFICTASFQALEKLLPTWLLSPPGSEAVEEVDPQLADLEDVVIRVAESAGRVQWSLNDRVYAQLAELQSVLQPLARLRPDLPVILDADGAVEIGHVIDAYDACSLAGFQKIQFAAKADGS